MLQRIIDAIAVRSTATHWVVVLSLTTAAAWTTWRTNTDAASARDRWEAVPAVLAAGAVAPGTVLADDDLVIGHVPRHVAPADAVAEPPVGAVTACALDAGTVVTAAHLSGGATTSLAPDERAVILASAAAVGLPPVTPGARVELVVADIADPFDPASGTPTGVVAGRVTDAVEGQVTVAVARSDAAAVSVALAAGRVSAVLAGPAPPD